MEALELFLKYKEKSLHGRYITLDSILPILNRFNLDNQLKIVGESVNQNPIYTYQIGNGATKIFLWSQMHGNESTTTKALIDFIIFLNSDTTLANMLRECFTFLTIPILNPDGAILYTRENANKVDLNRDSQELTQPESIILRGVFEIFQPDYCFNLHDQRTIFGVADTGKPATVSFLAPSFNQERDINTTRLKAISLIAKINSILQNYIPGQVGRFDDSFNINCIGDTFQNLGTPTILFEAGHFQNDYDREETRKYIFIALLASFTLLFENDVVDNEIRYYVNIPQNKTVFYDFIYKNIKINYDGNEFITNFAIQYKEELIEGKVRFVGYIAAIDKLSSFFGHNEYDAKGAYYSDNKGNLPIINQIADFSLDNKVVFVNGMNKV